MWERPTAISVVAGRGEGRTELTAFDRALMDAGTSAAIPLASGSPRLSVAASRRTATA
ncbi:MAG: hypothetical protein HYU43_00565 [Armatimonadetes bacterium]|nr:hypothetical protein [Armatimonadota bacterium]